jgi:TolA-binding protein
MRPSLRSFALVLVLSAFAAGRALGAESSDEQFKLAVDHYRHQRWQAACDAFAELLSSDVDPARAGDVRFYYGEAFMELGRWQQAREQYAELRKREPNHRFAKNAAYRSGDQDLAPATYRVAIDGSPEAEDEVPCHDRRN